MVESFASQSLVNRVSNVRILFKEQLDFLPSKHLDLKETFFEVLTIDTEDEALGRS